MPRAPVRDIIGYSVRRREFHNEYLCDSFTFADIGCYAHIRLLRIIGIVPSARWRRLHNWIGRMENRPSIQLDLREVNELFSTLFAPRPGSAG